MRPLGLQVARGKQEADPPPTPARPGPQRWVRRSPGLLRGRVWSRDARCSQVRRRQWQPRRPASHVATGAALSRPGAAGRGARPHLARERAERRDWDPGARAEGGSGRAESSAPRYGLARHSGSRDGRSLGWRLALVSRREPLEGSLRREPPRVGAGGPSSAIYKFPELPALFHPLAAPEAGRRGGRGSGSLLVAAAGLGWCRAARPQVQTPPPRPPGRVRGDPASGPKGARAPRRCVSAPWALEGAAGNNKPFNLQSNLD
ncbi:uncharacterized protein LOC144330572 [Macaca mulatta]